MFIFDIVPPEKRRGPWRVVGLSKSKDVNSSEVLTYFSTLSEDELDNIMQLLEAFTEAGAQSIPAKTRHEMDSNNKIFEFRKGRHRIAWFYTEGKIVICTHCFFKSTGPTPTSEKETALRVKQQYEAAAAAGKLKEI